MRAVRSPAWYSPESIARSIFIRPRVYGGAIAGTAAFILLPREWGAPVRSSFAWDAGGLVYLIFAFRLIATSHSENIKARASRRDDGRLVILTIILLAIVASFAAIAGLIGHAKQADASSSERVWLAALAGVTIVISWSVTQVAFALHYAHDYYRPSHGSDSGNGFEFPGCDMPDYWDFLYFSTSIGATSQTSDTAIRSRALRRLVTLHAVVAFFFNTAVLALTVNIAASLV